ncbi:MAG TPA: cytochrome P460 family protein [Kofleriaceae bacterium]
MRKTLVLATLATLAALGAACGGAPAVDREAGMRQRAAGAAATGEDRYAPLDVGADYPGYRKLTDRPFQSLDHGNRWVDVYVNAIGADAYLSGAPIPVGTIVVKTSWQDDGGQPSGVAGPVFVMQKRAAGYAPEHDDWYFAIHWANPPPEDQRKLGGPIYWRGKSPRAAYCWECHDLYDRHLGGLVSSTQLPR